MNAQKFTQKSLEAIQAAQQISIEHQNMQISQEHLLYALLTQEGGLIPELLQKMQVDAGAMTSRLEGMIDALPQVSGPGRDPEKVYVSQDVDTALIQAEKLADNMKDEYVSVEHIFLSLISQANSNLKAALPGLPCHQGRLPQGAHGRSGATPGSSARRPEETYDALKKYGHGPGGAGPEPEAGPGHRTGRRDPERHPDPVPENQEQPGAHRRARRGQNRHCRGPGPADRPGRRARQS